MMAGRLLYLVGATAARKQQLLQHLRARLTEYDPLVIAHRYVCGAPPAVPADVVVLSEAEYQLRRARGLFVLQWERKSVQYAIGTEINYWLAVGLSVLVNGSRGHMRQAFGDYPDMTIVWLSARATLAVADGRTPVGLVPEAPPRTVTGRYLMRLDANGSVSSAAEQLLGAIRDDRRAAQNG